MFASSILLKLRQELASCLNNLDLVWTVLGSEFGCKLTALKIPLIFLEGRLNCLEVDLVLTYCYIKEDFSPKRLPSHFSKVRWEAGSLWTCPAED